MISKVTKSKAAKQATKQGYQRFHKSKKYEFGKKNHGFFSIARALQKAVDQSKHIKKKEEVPFQRPWSLMATAEQRNSTMKTKHKKERRAPGRCGSRRRGSWFRRCRRNSRCGRRRRSAAPDTPNRRSRTCRAGTPAPSSFPLHHCKKKKRFLNIFICPNTSALADVCSL